MKKLIITYLGFNAAIASAIYLNKFNETDIYITSTMKFENTLQKIKLKKLSDFEIIILGAGTNIITENCIDLLNTILKENNITWITHYKLNQKFQNIKNKNLSFHFNEEIPLGKITSDFFNISNSYIKKLLENEKLGNKSILHNLIEEAKFYYFNFDNKDHYPELIKKLSNSTFKFSTHIKPDNKYYLGKFLFGKNNKIRNLKKEIEQIGQDSICNVLIEGESGTGKTTIAYSLHYASNRRDFPFKVVSCANFQESLLESELFGYTKGSFTGATSDKKGIFEQAEGGTVFLDEIGELPKHLQSKLLLVLQDGRIQKIGSEKEEFVNTRIITATNKNLKEEIKKGNFRSDLYYRIASICINSIPLREQKEDLEYFSQFILSNISKKREKNTPNLTKNSIDQLKNYDFPGNVRELENILERAFILDNWDFSHLNSENIIGENENFNTINKYSEAKDLESIKKEYILHIFKENDNNISRTARILKTSINTVKKYIKK